jgi:hypothetical protein
VWLDPDTYIFPRKEKKEGGAGRRGMLSLLKWFMMKLPSGNLKAINISIHRNCCRSQN